MSPFFAGARREDTLRGTFCGTPLKIPFYDSKPNIESHTECSEES